MRLTLFESKRNVQHVLDTAKISDIILLVIQAEQGIDEDGYLFLSLLRSQGFPSVIVVIQGLEQVANQKRYKEIKKEYETWIKKEFADPEPRMVLCDSAKDAKTLVRWINEQKVRTIHWRESHPYMLADKWQFLPNPQPQQQQQQQFASLVANQQPTGSLAISGYLRGQPLAANQLVHLVHFGTFQIDSVYILRLFTCFRLFQNKIHIAQVKSQILPWKKNWKPLFANQTIIKNHCNQKLFLIPWPMIK